MNKNAPNAATAAKKTDNEMAGKVIAAKRVAISFRTDGGNGLQRGFGTNIAMNGRRIVLSQKVHNGA